MAPFYRTEVHSIQVALPSSVSELLKWDRNLILSPGSLRAASTGLAASLSVHHSHPDPMSSPRGYHEAGRTAALSPPGEQLAISEAGGAQGGERKHENIAWHLEAWWEALRV